jgi:hypothetical protein
VIVTLYRYLAKALGIPIETMRVYSRGRESEYNVEVVRVCVIEAVRVCH